MTNREALLKIKETGDIQQDIKRLVKKIIINTFDYRIFEATDMKILDDMVEVHYEWCCIGNKGTNVVLIPIEWFDEGFDYRKAYKEFLYELFLEQWRRQEVARKKLEEEKEYETYLKLKEKFESKND